MRKFYNKSVLNHMSINIDGVLNNYKRKKITFCSHEDGRQMSDSEAREVFKISKYEGKRVLPMGDCYRFDYQTGCKGHIKSLKPTAEKLIDIENEYKFYLMLKYS